MNHNISTTLWTSTNSRLVETPQVLTILFVIRSLAIPSYESALSSVAKRPTEKTSRILVRNRVDSRKIKIPLVKTHISMSKNVENWEKAVKLARGCHTKHAWESFFSRYGSDLASTNNPKPLSDIFKLLKADRQSKQYSPTIFRDLIKGCLSCWNLELGEEICSFVAAIPSAIVATPVARLYLESGHPSLSRETANRALRLSNLSAHQRLQLELLICSSYAEEGKQTKSINMSKKLDAAIKSEDLSPPRRADLLQQMARIQYFLGRYQHAAELFETTSELYFSLCDWESTAKALFNAAACYHNSGGDRIKSGFAFVERARKVAEAHSLPGPLSHCETFYGLDAYQHGNFAEAREYFRRALEILPISDKSFRRLQILSMQALTHLASGRYHLARKFGKQTLDLAKLDDSERIKSRYLNLEAQLLWEDGLIPKSQNLLEIESESFELKGINTLEEISTFSRFMLQSALLNEEAAPKKAKISETLKKNVFNWLDYLFAEGQLTLNRGDYASAKVIFNDIVKRAKRYQDRYHEALGNLGVIQSQFAACEIDNVLDQTISEFEVNVAKIGSTPLKATVHIVSAARSYHKGEFSSCERSLRAASKQTQISFADKLIVSSWIATIEGRSSRLTNLWQTNLIARATRIFFAPSLTALDQNNFLIGNHYRVSLDRHPQLAVLLHFLLCQPDYTTTSQKLQTEVWNQSVNAQGWKQKIRNTIMRLRGFFPYTMAPILIHQDEIQLFSKAIEFKRRTLKGASREEEVIDLLAGSPMTSSQISKKLQISTATTKRTLKKMADQDLLSAVRHGRNIYYTVNTSFRP